MLVTFFSHLKNIKHEPSEMPGNVVLNMQIQGGIIFLLLAGSLTEVPVFALKA